MRPGARAGGSEAEAQGTGRAGRRRSRRPALWWQARARCGGQDAVHRGARNDDRAPAKTDQAQDRQGLSQAGGRALRQGRDRAEAQRRQRRLVLVAGGHQGRRRSLCEAHRIRTPGSPRGAVQRGQHGAWQQQDGAPIDSFAVDPVTLSAPSRPRAPSPASPPASIGATIATPSPSASQGPAPRPSHIPTALSSLDDSRGGSGIGIIRKQMGA